MTKQYNVQNEFTGKTWILILLIVLFGPFGLLYLLKRGPVKREILNK